MDQKKIDRINELAKKSKISPLSAEEKAEQSDLRQEYIASFRHNLEQTLKSSYVLDEKGKEVKIEKKK